MEPTLTDGILLQRYFCVENAQVVESFLLTWKCVPFQSSHILVKGFDWGSNDNDAIIFQIRYIWVVLIVGKLHQASKYLK